MDLAGDLYIAEGTESETIPKNEAAVCEKE